MPNSTGLAMPQLLLKKNKKINPDPCIIKYTYKYIKYIYNRMFSHSGGILLAGPVFLLMLCEVSSCVLYEYRRWTKNLHHLLQM